MNHRQAAKAWPGNAPLENGLQVHLDVISIDGVTIVRAGVPGVVHTPTAMRGSPAVVAVHALPARPCPAEGRRASHGGSPRWLGAAKVELELRREAVSVVLAAAWRPTVSTGACTSTGASRYKRTTVAVSAWCHVNLRVHQAGVTGGAATKASSIAIPHGWPATASACDPSAFPVHPCQRVQSPAVTPCPRSRPLPARLWLGVGQARRESRRRSWHPKVRTGTAADHDGRESLPD